MSQLNSEPSDFQAIDQFSGDLRAKLRLLELCNAIHGRRAAARLWEKFNMPRIDVATGSAGDAGASTSRTVFERFLADRCEVSPGARTQSSKLYRNYLVWCAEQHMPGSTQRAFSMALDECGIRRKHSDVVWFLDIKLKSAD